jgi:metal-dependent HD superfamily phosphatase/phosphodiesterase
MEDITYEQIRENEEIKNYVAEADKSLAAMGFTEHSFAHVTKCAKTVKDILSTFGYSEREIRLGQIAAYMHDIGNGINRVCHGQSGAMMAFNILTRLNMPPKDISLIIAAIGNHDESAAYPVNSIAAALIIADKSDVRRSRVRPNADFTSIHTKVNYSVVNQSLTISKENKSITLNLTIDTTITDIMDYFEIFLERMKLCKKACHSLDLRFKLVINGLELI